MRTVVWLLVLFLPCLPGRAETPYPLAGLCYGPFRDGQSPAYSIYPSRTQILDDLHRLRNTAVRLRTYGAHDIQAVIPRYARLTGFRVYAGAWLSSDTTANAAELDRLVTWCRVPPPAVLVVGSETLYRGDLTAAQLIGYLNDVRARTGRPVAVADTWYQIANQPEVVAAADVVLCHIHPYWEGQPAATAAAYVYQRYTEVAAAYPGKPVVIGETGWPSAGATIGAAVPSPANQQTFLRDWIALAERHDVPWFWFEAFDEKWKSPDPGGVERYWGLWNSDRTPKPAYSSLQTSPDPTVWFSRVSTYGSGGNKRVGVFGGAAGFDSADRTSYRIVLYGYTDTWRIQPDTGGRLPRLSTHGRWRSLATPADTYAALLVTASHVPPATLATLPQPGDTVLAVATRHVVDGALPTW